MSLHRPSSSFIDRFEAGEIDKTRLVGRARLELDDGDKAYLVGCGSAVPLDQEGTFSVPSVNGTCYLRLLVLTNTGRIALGTPYQYRNVPDNFRTLELVAPGYPNDSEAPSDALATVEHELEGWLTMCDELDLGDDECYAALVSPHAEWQAEFEQFLSSIGAEEADDSGASSYLGGP